MRTPILLLTLLAAPVAAQQPPARPTPAPRPPVTEAEQVREELRRAAEARLTGTVASRTDLETLLRNQMVEARVMEEMAVVSERALTQARSLGVIEEALVRERLAEVTAEQVAVAQAWATERMAEETVAGTRRGGLASLRPQQGTAEDSLYRAARETLNRGEYARAAQLFRTFQERFPAARSAPAALYWRAFALYRAGATEDLRTALAALELQRTRYPATADDADAAALRVRVNAALAARGDAQAAAAVRAASAQGGSCDREEMEVRAEALNALVRQDEAAAGPILGRVLAQRDECSVTLRRRAVYILGRRTDPDVATRLLEVARNDPDRSVRGDAVALIGRMPGEQAVRALEQLFSASTDPRTQSDIFSALRSHDSPEARRVLRRFVERTDLPETLRASAVAAMTGGSGWVVVSPAAISTVTLGQGVNVVTPAALEVERARAVLEATERRTPAPAPVAVATGEAGLGALAPGGRVELSEDDAAFLRGVYGRESSRVVKEAIIGGLARAGGTGNEQWLMSVVRNESETMRLRTQALSRMRTARFPVEDLARLYDGLSDRELRSTVISLLGSREEDAATDKLFEIARSGTDPQTRRQAITALSRKKDARTTRLLLELVERQP